MKSFFKKYLIMIIVTIILLSLYSSLLNNHSTYFHEIEKNLSSQNSICLNSEIEEDDIKKVLLQQHYVQTNSEADFIAGIITKRFQERPFINSLFDLNKNYWKATKR